MNKFNWLYDDGQVLLGREDSIQELYVAQVDKNGKIESIRLYDFYDKSVTADGNGYVTSVGGGVTFETKKITLKVGDKIPKGFKPINVDKRLLKELQSSDVYQSDFVSSCQTCGMFHDTTDDYGTSSFKFTEDGLYCRTSECLDPADVLTELNRPEDLFKAGDITGFEDPKGFKEVTTLFCDSSGLGSPGEPALTKSQALEKAKAIISEHPKAQLYAGLTGVGQFQVYVTIYKKTSSKKRKAA